MFGKPPTQQKSCFTYLKDIYGSCKYVYSSMSDYNLLLFYKLFEVFTMLIYYIGQLANIDICQYLPIYIGQKFLKLVVLNIIYNIGLVDNSVAKNPFEIN